MRVVLVILGGCVAWSPRAEDLAKSLHFTSAEKCGVCHVDLYQQWQTSAHSRAAVDPVFWQFFQQAARDQKDLSAAACLTCHSPVGSVTKEFSVTGRVSFPVQLSAVGREGVTCDFCHTIQGGEYFGKNIGVGVYRYGHKGDTATKYGTHADATTTEHATEVSPFLKNAEFCGICHKFTHPVSDTVWQDTYAEWKDGPYAKEGRTCQDCHMPTYEGRGTTDGPVRTNLSAHVFPGSYSDMIKKAATVSVWAGLKPKSVDRKLQVKALVSNSGSGHLMPTGIPGIRQMWLEVVVRGANTLEVASRKSEFLIEILGADGKPAMPWNAVSFGRDTRIAPRKSRETIFEVPLDASGEPVEVEATVFYRQISEFAAQAAGIKASPPIGIAADRIRVFPDGRIEKLAMASPR